jgi:hypothetical protein
MLEYTQGKLGIGVKTLFDKEIEQGKKDSKTVITL